jgi:CBS domain containing-hemolysin-like protein
VSAGELSVWLVMVLVGLVASALWSGLETALYVVSRLRLEARLADPATRGRALLLRRELDQPQRALATLLLMNNLTNFLVTLALSALLGATDLPAWAVTLVSIAVVTPTLLIVSEALPKELFRAQAERLAYSLVPVLTTARYLLTATGVLHTLLLLDKAVRRALGQVTVPADPRERIQALMKEAEGSGLLSLQQTDLLDRASALAGSTVADVMTHWPRVVWARAGMPRSAARRLVLSRGFELLPVVNDRGRVVGQLRAIDLMPGGSELTSPQIRPVVRLAPTTSIRSALAELRGAESAAAVVEAAGRPLGLITLQDLIDAVLGESKHTPYQQNAASVNQE